MDWPDFYKKCIENHNWTPRQISEDISYLQLLILWGGERGGGKQSRAERREILNGYRKRHGLPPLKPRETKR